MKNTQIYSGFPGVGKTSLYQRKNTNLQIVDSDSSKFDKKTFPHNYIDNISKSIGLVDIICISSHDVVREELIKRHIGFNLVYPDISLKDEYIQRYAQRGNNEDFIKLLHDNWTVWISELQNQKYCTHIVLPTNTFLSDII